MLASPDTAAFGIADRVVTAPRDDLRRDPSRSCPVRVEHRLRLERGQRHVVGADRREVVRIELERQRLAQRSAQARPARREHERDIDVTVLEPHPRLVQRPRAVHLHVRLGDRRPRARGFEHLHERERAAGEVVGAARAREAHVAPRHPDVGERLGDRRQQHQGLGLARRAARAAPGRTRRSQRHASASSMRADLPSENVLRDLVTGEVGLAGRLPARHRVAEAHAAVDRGCRPPRRARLPAATPPARACRCAHRRWRCRPCA